MVRIQDVPRVCYCDLGWYLKIEKFDYWVEGGEIFDGIPYLGNNLVLAVGVFGVGRMGRSHWPEDPICLGIRAGPFFWLGSSIKK
jgi:hypothetical protein